MLILILSGYLKTKVQVEHLPVGGNDLGLRATGLARAVAQVPAMKRRESRQAETSDRSISPDKYILIDFTPPRAEPQLDSWRPKSHGLRTFPG